MQVTETLSEGLKRGFTVVVPGEDIETRRTARLADLGKTLRLPGFRPGKVPLPIVRQRYGTAVTAEVLEESVNQATEKVLSERKMRPAQTPKIDVVSMDTGPGAAKDLEFKVEFELLPDIELPDFGQISLVRRKAEVPPAAIDQALAEIATRNRELIEITAEELDARAAPPDAEGAGEPGTPNPGAATGEVLTVDFVGKIDDKPFPNGSGTDINVELGGAGFIPGFADQLEGMRPGESKTISVTFPEEYGNKDLAGKAATFDITAKKLSRQVVPTVDDALAQKMAFDDLDGLRKVVRERFQRDYDVMSRVRLKRELLDALAEHVNFDAPQGMVDQEFEQIWQRLEAERKEGRLDEDDKDKDEAALRAEYRGIAERRVKLGLVLAEIGRANNILVAPEELTRAKRAEAARYPGQEAQMMEFFRKYPQAEQALRGPIFEEKVVDFVLELAKVTDETVTPEELAQEPPPPKLPSASSSATAPSEAGEAAAEAAPVPAESPAPAEASASAEVSAAAEPAPEAPA
jgi:trigger factor